jgi:hypothetical protein
MTPRLAQRMREAADTLAEVAALYGYPHPQSATWAAEELRHEAQILEESP